MSNTYNHCDPIFSFTDCNLNEYRTIYDTTLVSICEGEAFEGLSEAGTYSDTLYNEDGCADVITIDLTVLPEKDPAYVVGNDNIFVEGKTILYPNPCSESFSIKNTDGLLNVSVFNIQMDLIQKH